MDGRHGDQPGAQEREDESRSWGGASRKERKRKGGIKTYAGGKIIRTARLTGWGRTGWKGKMKMLPQTEKQNKERKIRLSLEKVKTANSV